MDILKKSIPLMLLLWNLSGRSSWPKKYTYTWKVYFANNFFRIWEFFFTHVTFIIVIVLHTANFVSTKLIFSEIQISLPNFAFLEQNHPALLKEWFLKKMLLKRTNTCRLFFYKIIGSNNSFTLIENNFMLA